MKNMNLFKDPCIFHQEWWLEAISPGQWGVCKVIKGNEQFASMPYIISKKYGLTLLNMPPLTQHLGPWTKLNNGKYSTKLSQEKELFNELLNQLPNYDIFRQRFSPSITNWLPFYWNNFKQTTKYTYRLTSDFNESMLWKGMQGNIRREIKKARNIVSIESTDDVDIMWNIWESNFKNKNKKIKIEKNVFNRLNDACTKQKARKIFIAVDEQKHIHAAVYLVWDKETAYYLIGGAEPMFRTSGAVSFLMYESIKFALDKGLNFDFEGSMIESVERFFRGFGAIQTPYFEVTKMNGLLNKLNISDRFFQ